jgi:hypothetical protein
MSARQPSSALRRRQPEQHATPGKAWAKPAPPEAEHSDQAEHSDLAAQQRALRDLILGTGDGAPPTDPYVRQVAGDDALPVVRWIGESWRQLTLSRTCALTWRTLGARGGQHEALAAFTRQPGLPPYLAPRALVFLDVVAAGPDPLSAAVAGLERALRVAAAGTPGLDGQEVVIDWPVAPEPFLAALVGNGDLDDAAVGPPAWHRTRARASTPLLVTIERLAPVAPP